MVIFRSVGWHSYLSWDTGNPQAADWKFLSHGKVAGLYQDKHAQGKSINGPQRKVIRGAKMKLAQQADNGVSQRPKVASRGAHHD